MAAKSHVEVRAELVSLFWVKFKTVDKESRICVQIFKLYGS